MASSSFFHVSFNTTHVRATVVMPVVANEQFFLKVFPSKRPEQAVYYGPYNTPQEGQAFYRDELLAHNVVSCRFTYQIVGVSGENERLVVPMG